MSATARNVLRELLTWALVALMAAALLYFYNDLRGLLAPSSDPSSRVAMPASGNAGQATGFGGEVRLKSDPRGHFVFDASINGRTATLMADTGATIVVLTYEDARKVGLSPQRLDFSAQVKTANGIARVAPFMLDCSRLLGRITKPTKRPSLSAAPPLAGIGRVRVGDITVRNVQAAVAERDALSVNLLGMSFLGRLSRFEMSGGDLVLVR